MFAEQPRTTSPDDFFGVISKFLTALSECHQQIWEERENLERIKKQTMARSILSRKCKTFSQDVGKKKKNLIELYNLVCRFGLN
ncbi:unnamed protein product [Onchocerca flexuosa]|uniref:FH2 domain-containing protein n=1 Tax=Onchocerca flexuosa TaxID=387005 RepID=A0A183HN36_9BILA|nr:unnamed protein product [Onchocerca flexuosa]